MIALICGVVVVMISGFVIMACSITGAASGRRQEEVPHASEPQNSNYLHRTGQ